MKTLWDIDKSIFDNLVNKLQINFNIDNLQYGLYENNLPLNLK